MVVAMCFVQERAHGFSLALDSVREWGKFPRLCVDVYRWGDRFFNTYDTAYVQGTGYKFNVKTRVETWQDRYNFALPDGYRMAMNSDPCTSTGLYVSYLAVSAGYDINVNKILGNREPARKRFRFQFNCALLSAEFYWITNDVSTRIKSFGRHGEQQHYDINFKGINTSIFGVDAYYSLNNKRYSRAAGFYYSKNQLKSQGSFFGGFSYWRQDFKFDFTQLPLNIINTLPPSWAESGYEYNVVNSNYALRLGYGYNWVFAPHWVAAVSESPIIGLKHGFINEPGNIKYSFSAYNRLQASVVWSNRHWFAGMVGTLENGIVYDKDHSLLNSVLNLDASVGYRFNLW